MVPGTMSLVPSSRLHFIKWSTSYSFSNCCFAASFDFIISQEETDTGGHDTGIIILRTWTFPLCVAWYKMRDVASQAQYQLSSICGMSLKFFTNFTSIVMLEIIMKTSSQLYRTQLLSSRYKRSDHVLASDWSITCNYVSSLVDSGSWRPLICSALLWIIHWECRNAYMNLTKLHQAEYCIYGFMMCWNRRKVNQSLIVFTKVGLSIWRCYVI